MEHSNKIIIKNLSKTYGNRKVLNNINLEIDCGMFGLLGHNGAGKSTLMKILTTLTEPDKGGEIEICGYNALKQKLDVRKIVGFLPQEFNIYPQMTAEEFLDYIARLNDIKSLKDRKEIVTQSLENVNLLDSKDKKVGGFSGGMKRRLGIAQALIKNPKVLIVDEPTAGLDPEERIRFRTMLVELSQNKIVILSTHIVEDISASCEKIALFVSGNSKFVGSPVDFVKNVDNMVWEKLLTNNSELIEMKRLYSIVSMRQTSKGVVVRFISDENNIKTSEGLISVTPNLEDAYLNFMESIQNKSL
ncbi:MAG: ABC transporter ATP-binding protein [Clostridium sp.]